jgi:hypothetical protein
MIPRKPRDFDCPEGGRCTDGRCTRDHCVHGEKSRVAAPYQKLILLNEEDGCDVADSLVRAFSFRWD